MNNRSLWSLLLTILVALGIIVPSSTNAAEPSTNLVTKAECLESARKLAARVNEFIDRYGFVPRVEIPDALPFEYKDADLYKEYLQPTAMLGGYGSNPVQIHMLGRSGAIILFRNNLASRASVGRGAPLFSEKTKPSWTAEKAVTLAEEFVAAVLTEFPRNLQLDIANYGHTYQESPKYYAGHWFIRWARTDSFGRKFLKDCVVVQMTEKEGPRSVAVHMASNYIEPGGQLIPQGEAISKARKPSRQILDWPENHVTYWRHRFVGQPTAELKIVNPNYLLRWKTVEEVVNHQSRDARLAWVVSYKTIYDGPANTKGPWLGERGIRVWIDAENGEFVGGDFD